MCNKHKRGAPRLYPVMRVPEHVGIQVDFVPSRKWERIRFCRDKIGRTARTNIELS